MAKRYVKLEDNNQGLDNTETKSTNTYGITLLTDMHIS